MVMAGSLTETTEVQTRKLNLNQIKSNNHFGKDFVSRLMSFAGNITQQIAG